jgi:hypothetical protein
MTGRRFITALLSGTVSSIIGTVLWVAIEGGTGTSDPLGSVAVIAGFTLLFTIPGAIFLMVLAFLLAAWGIGQSRAAVVVIVVGSLTGVALLSLVSGQFMPLGALFGLVTASAFVCLQWVFRSCRPNIY